MDYGDYVNGYIERQTGGQYGGVLRIEGIDLSPVQGVYFTSEGDNYLWIKRKPIMEYSFERQEYINRERRPRLDIYMKKQVDGDGVVAYKGEFMFMRFKFSVTGVWDSILGKDTRQRLNLYVERLPLSQQTLLQSINERKRGVKC